MNDAEPEQLNIETWLREQAANDFTCETKLVEAADTIQSLKTAVLVQAKAVKVLEQADDRELNILRRTAREADIAIRTLDSEREVNSLLTDEVLRLRSAMSEAIREARAPHYGDKYVLLDNYDDAILILEKALEIK